MITIGITESDTNFQYYAPYIKGEDKTIEIIILSYKHQQEDDLRRCDGIVLSGGVDVHPKFYNHSRLDYPLAQAFNEKRDEWELHVFAHARANHLPVLAICRGMQIVNIALGGDLVQDIEEHGKHNHRTTAGQDGVHPIHLEKESMIFSLTNCTSGMVNSAHHQGLGRLAEEIMVSAQAEDSTIEAIEYKDKRMKPFLLGIQWHPERMFKSAGDDVFSKNVREAFIQAVRYNMIEPK